MISDDLFHFAPRPLRRPLSRLARIQAVSSLSPSSKRPTQPEAPGAKTTAPVGKTEATPGRLRRLGSRLGRVLRQAPLVLTLGTSFLGLGLSVAGTDIPAAATVAALDSLARSTD
jgi:hypothetical protein